MNATVWVGLLMVTCCEPFTAMNAVICEGISVDDTPSWNALARMLVIRITRVPAVPGASIGIPRNTTELALFWTPENTLGCDAYGLGEGIPTKVPFSGHAAPCPPELKGVVQRNCTGDPTGGFCTV